MSKKKVTPSPKKETKLVVPIIKAPELNNKFLFYYGAAVAIISFIIFSPSLFNGFVPEWDDTGYVVRNFLIRDLSWNGIKNIFSTYVWGNYHPLTILSIAFEWTFYKLNPFGYHLTNLIIHALNTFLVFFFVYKLTGNKVTTIVVGLLFGIHPLHVESVTWISERKDVLYSFFFMISLVLYLYYHDGNKDKKPATDYKLYALSLLAFILSCFSKGMAVVLPLLLVLVDYLRGRKFTRKMVIEKIPFLLVSLTFGIVAIFAQKSTESVNVDVMRYSFIDKVTLAGYGLFFYIYKMIAPVNLSALYPYPSKVNDMYPILVLLSPVIIGLLILLLIIYRKKTRLLTFGSLFFVIAILPVLQILPVGNAIAADRYFYISSIGLFILLGEGFRYLYEKKFNTASARKGLITASVVILGIFSVLTWQRTQIWKDPVTLFSDVMSNYPDNPIPYNNVGRIVLNNGNKTKAVELFKKAIELNPYYDIAYNNLGDAYNLLEQYEDAIPMCKRAIELNPKLDMAYNNLGKAYYKTKRYDMAIDVCNQEVEKNPKNADLFNNLGNSYYEKGLYDKAIEMANKSIEINPKFAEPYGVIANSYNSKGDYNKSLEYSTKAIELNKDYAVAYNAQGISYINMKKLDEAIPKLQKSISIDKKYVEAYSNLGAAYAMKKEFDKALEVYQKALELNPYNGSTYRNLALTYSLMGNQSKSVELLRKAAQYGDMASAQWLKANGYN